VDEKSFIEEWEQRRAQIASEAPSLTAGELSIGNRLKTPTRLPALTEEQMRARDERIKKQEEERRQLELLKRWQKLIDARGTRYADCQLRNYEIYGTPQEQEQQLAVRNALVAYCHRMPDAIQAGEGLILFGPKGTGKDHFAMALARHAILGCGRSLIWVNGMDLWGEIRDAMDSGTSERSLISRYTWPDVLYLSDPLPPTGDLGDHQKAMLFRILDARYSNSRATWVTVNVDKREELEKRLGPQNADRLRDGATALFCYWGSYRKAK